MFSHLGAAATNMASIASVAASNAITTAVTAAVANAPSAAEAALQTARNLYNNSGRDNSTNNTVADVQPPSSSDVSTIEILSIPYSTHDKRIRDALQKFFEVAARSDIEDLRSCFPTKGQRAPIARPDGPNTIPEIVLIPEAIHDKDAIASLKIFLTCANAFDITRLRMFLVNRIKLSEYRKQSKAYAQARSQDKTITQDADENGFITVPLNDDLPSAPSPSALKPPLPPCPIRPDEMDASRNLLIGTSSQGTPTPRPVSRFTLLRGPPPPNTTTTTSNAPTREDSLAWLIRAQTCLSSSNYNTLLVVLPMAKKGEMELGKAFEEIYELLARYPDLMESLKVFLTPHQVDALDTAETKDKLRKFIAS